MFHDFISTQFTYKKIQPIHEVARCLNIVTEEMELLLQNTDDIRATSCDSVMSTGYRNVGAMGIMMHDFKFSAQGKQL